MEKVINEFRVIETEDGFRIEIKGDKEAIRKMLRGFGPGSFFGPGGPFGRGVRFDFGPGGFWGGFGSWCGWKDWGEEKPKNV